MDSLKIKTLIGSIESSNALLNLLYRQPNINEVQRKDIATIISLNEMSLAVAKMDEEMEVANADR